MFSFSKLPEQQRDLLELSQRKLINFFQTISVLFPKGGFCVFAFYRPPSRKFLITGNHVIFLQKRNRLFCLLAERVRFELLPKRISDLQTSNEHAVFLPLTY